MSFKKGDIVRITSGPYKGPLAEVQNYEGGLLLVQPENGIAAIYVTSEQVVHSVIKDWREKDQELSLIHGLKNEGDIKQESPKEPIIELSYAVKIKDYHLTFTHSELKEVQTLLNGVL